MNGFGTRPHRDPRSRARRFTLMETVMAGAVLTLVLTGAFSGLRLIEDFQQRNVEEQRALTVLDNVLERLAVQGACTPDTVKHVVREEFARSALTAESSIQATVAMEGATLRVCIGRPGRRPLAEVRMGDET